MITKKAWDDPRYAKNTGFLSFNLERPVKIFRKATFNSPLVGAAALGLLVGGLGYHYGPTLDRLLSPKFGGGNFYDGYSDEDITRRKRFWGTGAGLLTALGFLATQYDARKPWAGFKEYAPMDLHKHANLPSLSIDDSTRLILQDNALDQSQKEVAISLLRSFDMPPKTQITGNDLVGQAISTGLSAATGAAVGFLTANALGLPNPKSTAILGAVANTAGGLPALTLSTIFGS